MDHPLEIRTMPVIMYFSIYANCISLILKEGSQRVLWSVMDHLLEIRAVPVIMKHVFIYFCKPYLSISANCISLILKLVLWSIMDHPLEIRAVGRQPATVETTNLYKLSDCRGQFPDPPRYRQIAQNSFQNGPIRKRPIHANYYKCHTKEISNITLLNLWSQL